jgi:hypothetical protein
MGFSSWLGNPKRHGTPRPQPTFRPTLEALEARWLPSSGSTVLTVASTKDSGGGTLRSAIAQAEQSNGTDTIVFNLKKSDQDATGHWTIALTTGELDITKSLNIQGPGAGQLAISGGPWGFRVFEVAANAQVSLSGMCIENGGNMVPYPVDYGGGILNYGVLTVSGCRLTDNVAYSGGGIYNTGTLTVSGCELDYNSANGGYGGGGIYNAGTLTVSDSTLDNNHAYVQYEIDPASLGGGILNLGTATVSGCRFFYNHANYGGAIWNAGPLAVSGSTFVSNDIYGSYTDGGGNTFLTNGPQINSLSASAATVTAGSPLTLTANITDPVPDSSISGVEFFDANGLVGYGTQTSPGVWTLTFSTAGWAAGTYTFSAIAWDNYGLRSWWTPTVTVQVT